MITAYSAKKATVKSSTSHGIHTSNTAIEPSLTVQGPDHVAFIESFSTSVNSADPRNEYQTSNRDSDAGILPTSRWKRSLDLICIAISLPLVLPLMALIVFWIRLVSSGPALFRQERIGQNGKRFILYKFRSMKMNAGTNRHETYLRHLVKSDSPMIKLDLLCDSRLIPGGCLLRAAGLDELPQLLNVLRAEMSLVGPRPCLVQEFAYFSAQQRERFTVLPGLTGKWQVSGKNRSTFSEMNAMDIQYVRNPSLTIDLGIILRTPSVLVRQMAEAAKQKIVLRQGSRIPDSEAGPKCGTQRIG